MDTEKNRIGCSIYNVDINRLSNDDIDELKRLLYRNRIVVVKNQELNEQQYCDFANRFGRPVPYLQENYHHPDYPLIFVSSNIKREGERRIGVSRTGGYWHSDTSFEKEPKPITMLLPKVLPVRTERTTRFVDMHEVYKALPDRLLKEIKNENFIHSGRWRYKVRPEDAGLDVSEILEMIDFHVKPEEHPTILIHPYTNDKIVYCSPGFTIGITNKGLDDSKRILDEIFHIAASPEFVTEIAWSLGDLIVWDNRYLMHCSGRKKSPTEDIHKQITKEEDTMMYRITLHDDYPLCANWLLNDNAVLR